MALVPTHATQLSDLHDTPWGGPGRDPLAEPGNSSEPWALIYGLRNTGRVLVTDQRPVTAGVLTLPTAFTVEFDDPEQPDAADVRVELVDGELEIGVWQVRDNRLDPVFSHSDHDQTLRRAVIELALVETAGTWAFVRDLDLEERHALLDDVVIGRRGKVRMAQDPRRLFRALELLREATRLKDEGAFSSSHAIDPVFEYVAAGLEIKSVAQARRLVKAAQETLG